jgi:hypothetical protein
VRCAGSSRKGSINSCSVLRFQCARK